MNRILAAIGPLAATALAGLLWTGTAHADTVLQRDIPGIPGATFNLTARDGYISTPDGNSIYTWGYANGDGPMQYPGPTLIVPQDAWVTVNLTNALPVPVSIVFPGQIDVIAGGGSPGVLTAEAVAPGGTVTYNFTASQPGTFQYHSGTNSHRQVEMGLLGALIVEPSDFGADELRTAYGAGTGSAYDHEHLFFLTGMDLNVHEAVEAAGWAGGDVAAAIYAIDTGEYHPVYWFINGRSLPDDLFPDGAPWLPNQPYGALVLANPGQRVLIRFIGGTSNASPLHTHGNNALMIARDGELLQTAGGDPLSFSINTFTPPAGSTMDAIFSWTGKGMGWDFYGTPLENTDSETFDHTCIDGDADGFADVGVATNWAWEPCAEHYQPTDATDAFGNPVEYTKRLPVHLPGTQDLMLGGFWSGSPYLGHAGALPPGEGGLNPWNGYTFPWHSHHEVEVVTNDVFPGGNFSVFVVVPPDAPTGP